LIYFAQFLADLGIDATTELKETAADVLFTVTPKDGSEALDSSVVTPNPANGGHLKTGQ